MPMVKLWTAGVSISVAKHIEHGFLRKVPKGRKCELGKTGGI